MLRFPSRQFRNGLLVVSLAIFAHPAESSAQNDAAEAKNLSVRGKLTEHPRFLASLDRRNVEPYCEAISPDGRYAIAQTYQTETILFDLSSRTEIAYWPSAASQYSFNDDSKYFLRLQADTLSVHAADSLRVVARWRAKPKYPRPPGEYLQLNACLSPDGSLVAIENLNHSFDDQMDADILIGDVQTGELSDGIQYPFKDANETSQIHFALAFAGFNDRLLIQQLTYAPGRNYRRSGLVDLKNGGLVCEFPHDATLRFNRDSSSVAAATRSTRSDTGDLVEASQSSEIKVYDVRSGQRSQLLNAPGTIRDFDLDRDGSRLIASVQTADAQSPQSSSTGTPDPAARLTRLYQWDLTTGERVTASTPLRLPIAQVRYAVDNTRCLVGLEQASGVDDYLELVVEILDVQSGDRISEQDWLPRGSLDDLHAKLFLFPDGERFINRANPLQIQSLPGGSSVWQADARNKSVQQAAFAPNGRYCWTDERLTDIFSGQQRQWLDCEKLKFILDGKAVFYKRYSDLGILSTASNETLWRQGFQWNGRILCADISADAGRVALILQRDRFSADNQPRQRQLVLIDRQNQDNPKVLEMPARQLVFDATGNTLFVATDEAIQRIEFATAKLLGDTVPMPGETLSMQCLPQGNRLIVAGQSASNRQGYRNVVGTGWLACLDLETGQVIDLQESNTPITAVSCSFDGTVLAAGNGASDDASSQIWIWDVETLQQMQTIEAHRLRINDLAFSPNGKFLLSAANDGAVLWDLGNDGNHQSADAPPDNRVFSDELEPIEVANAYTGQIRKIKPYQGPWLVPPPQPPLTFRRSKADWPLIKIHQSREVERTSPLFDWVQAAAPGYHITEQVDWSSAESEWLRRFDFGSRSADWNYRIAYDRSQRHIVLLNDERKIVQQLSRASGISHAALSPSARQVAIVPLDRIGDQPNPNQIQVDIFDAQTGAKQCSTSPTEGIHVWLVELEQHDRFLHVNDNQRAVLIFDAQNGGLLARYEPQPFTQFRSRLSLDGRFVATSKLSGNSVVLRDPSTLNEIKRLPAKFTVTWMRFTPKSDRILIGQAFGEGMELVECFDVASEQLQWSCRMAASRDVAFDQSGEWMLSEAQVGSPLDVLCHTGDGRIAAVFSTAGSANLERPCLSKPGGTVHLGSPAGPIIWPQPQQALRAELHRGGGQIAALLERGTTVVDIHSESGIGAATIRRESPQWPKSILVRLHLQGLELFQVDTGETAVEWSKSSGPGQEVRVSLRTKNAEKILPANSPYYAPLRIANERNSKSKADAFFEIRLPEKFLENNPQTIQLKWIDFYRN